MVHDCMIRRFMVDLIISAGVVGILLEREEGDRTEVIPPACNGCIVLYGLEVAQTNV